MITLHRIIIHELKKEQGKTEATLDLSDDLTPQTADSYQMLVELEKRYSTLSQTYAVFEQNPITNFPVYCREYVSICDNNSFIEYSKKSAKILEGIVKKIYNAKGGYLIFVEYENRDRHLAIFLVRNKKGRALSKDNKSGTFILNDSIYVDVDNLSMAGRINTSLFNSDSLTPNTRYITFINKRNEDSDFFLNWFCATDKHSNKEDTRIFREIIGNIDLPSSENGQRDMDRDTFIKGVLNIIHSTPNKIVDLRSIGEVFYGDRERLIEYANSQEKIINHEFKPDTQELKRLVVLRANADKIKLDFPLDYLRKNLVTLNEEEGQIVIKSTALLNKIISEKRSFESKIDE
ncbi:nucleoid-associated protein [Runella salmonicolor]|uniref:Nucleoid-associated protein n=1 Tax=Runella salmonicolor TaxID=2950278 RepID=A0ABT1FWD3_9BACT|nr:nucleoid-associated protein [Runella salmonicolor]MCP1384782.1 nucleoid-associated protein [Runella salmonicolor]